MKVVSSAVCIELSLRLLTAVVSAALGTEMVFDLLGACCTGQGNNTIFPFSFQEQWGFGKFLFV